MRNPVCKAAIFTVLQLTFFNVSFANTGEELFKNKCAMCHNVGGGRLVGPDLAGVTEKRSETWLIKFIQSSQTLIKSGDVEAKAIFDEFSGIMMPDQDVSEEQVRLILAYISGSSETESAAEPPAETTAAEEQPPASTEDIEYGKGLFQGTVAFEGQGASCVSCHNVQNQEVFAGGSLAVDITKAYSRLNSAGIKGILQNIPFPAMKKAYENKSFTDKEIFSLVAFLKQIDEQSSEQPKTSYGARLFSYGFIGFLVFLMLVSFIWSGRKRDTVNKSIFDRQKY